MDGMRILLTGGGLGPAQREPSDLSLPWQSVRILASRCARAVHPLAMHTLAVHTRSMHALSLLPFPM